ncbi:ribosomal-protein-alanine N-acetyltransferase [bacterium DOLJORAL78_65_58]|nr:MAG: ribosomal-protein-alanine N-acetyltransferase [bacterium DOLZORAL124_64_63]PIE76278.1 MAG: ribosomal-protein-alanine N-acetyltransferase [bacterium DOLJORAL78_65_58]
MSALLIRDGRLEDLGAVTRLEERCFSDPWSPANLLGELQPDILRLPLVAELDGVVCGYLMAWRVADQLHILNIAAAPQRRRCGVGTALLREAARRGLQTGQTELTLEVRDSNRGARAFYRRHRFAETGLRRGYYQDNGEDAVIMTARSEDVLAG